MRVDRLTLKDFTVFERAEFEFSPGLNVLIGANGTGKSHVLKVLYSITRSIAAHGPNASADANPRPEAGRDLGQRILGTLGKTFRPEPSPPTLIPLIRRGAGSADLTAQADFGTVTIGLHGKGTGATVGVTLPPGVAVFIPANEVLSMYPGFVAAYERRELSFDETYRDLCIDLSANPLRSVSPPGLAELVAKLDNAVGGKTVLRGDRFYVSLSEDWLLEAPMLAEGLRKLASITHLIRNGSLAPESVLFWDEPETNINPKLIRTVAQTLLELAAAGIQVFVATHDYLLSNELSLAAEYQTMEAKQAAVKFFALSRTGPTAPVEAEWGGTLADLRHNPILEEFAAHYDRERNLFYGQGPLQTPEPTK